MNSSKHVVGKAVLILLIVFAAVFDLFWLIGTIGVSLEGSGGGNLDPDYISYARSAGEPYLEKIGTQYEGNARAGYTYYRVHVPVFSAGTQALSQEYDLYMDAEGADYSDVQMYYPSYDQEDIFTYSNVEIVPPGQKGELTQVIQIRDGVSNIRVTVYAYGDDYYNEKNGRQAEISVP